jgi:exonuclease III
MGATRQLDFVFCSTPLAERVRASALNRDLQEWGPSDHSRILIELDA